MVFPPKLKYLYLRNDKNKLKKNNKHHNIIEFENKIYSELDESMKFEVKLITRDHWTEIDFWNNSMLDFTPVNLERPAKIKLLKNGGIINTRNNSTFYLSNTCAFDSVMQAITACLCDSKKLQDIVRENCLSSPIIELAATLSNNFDSKDVYNMRLKLLTNIFQNFDDNNRLKIINCETTCINILKKLKHVSYKETYKCRKCNSTDEILFEVVPLNMYILSRGINLLKEAILSNRKFCQRIICNKNNCNGLLSHTIQYCNIIFIEYFLDVFENYVRLKDIPNTLELNNIIYFLRAAIEFQLPVDGTIGHFVTFAKRLDGTWEVYNDLKDNVTTASSNSVINTTLLLYTI